MTSIRETAEGLQAAGVMNQRTMREFDELYLKSPRPLKPLRRRVYGEDGS